MPQLFDPVRALLLAPQARTIGGLCQVLDDTLPWTGFATLHIVSARVISIERGGNHQTVFFSAVPLLSLLKERFAAFRVTPEMSHAARCTVSSKCLVKCKILCLRSPAVINMYRKTGALQSTQHLKWSQVVGKNRRWVS